MLRARELRTLDSDELEARLKELKETLFNLRFQHATGQLDNPMRIKETKREIARVCTVMTEREFDIHAEAFEEAEGMPPVSFETETTDRAEMQAEIDSEEELEEEAAEERIGVAHESDEQLEEEVEEELKDL
jgi:large subunit ribosomal protein L29